TADLDRGGREVFWRRPVRHFRLEREFRVDVLNNGDVRQVSITGVAWSVPRAAELAEAVHAEVIGGAKPDVFVIIPRAGIVRCGVAEPNSVVGSVTGAVTGRQENRVAVWVPCREAGAANIA